MERHLFFILYCESQRREPSERNILFYFVEFLIFFALRNTRVYLCSHFCINKYIFLIFHNIYIFFSVSHKGELPYFLF